MVASAPSESSPLDAAQLKRENDLLTNEVQRLRAELARLTPRGESSGTPVGQPDAGRAPDERARQALEDITWLVDRLSHSPLGPVLRARPGFRAMLERYGRR